MRIFISLLLLIPCFLLARDHYPETKFMDQDVDCQLVSVLKDKPMAEKMNAYCENKIYLLTQAFVYSKRDNHYGKEWYYMKGQIDAFNQIMEVFEMKDPAQAHLPRPQLSSSYIFARSKGYFVYPNNYNHFVTHFKNTFQHGGISLEEVLIPFVVLQAK